MTAPAVIIRDAFYDHEAIRRTLGVKDSAVDSARKRGDLRSVKRGGRILVRGDWLEAWLIGAAPREEALAR
jgi:hypothetical protein